MQKKDKEQQQDKNGLLIVPTAAGVYLNGKEETLKTQKDDMGT